MNNFFIIFGIVLLIVGGWNIDHAYKKKDKIVLFLGLLGIAFGIIFILIPYRNYKDFYEINTTPIDNEYYYIGAEIIDQSIAGTTVFETETGEKYTFNTNPEWDWDAIYLLTMDNNATPYDTTDDIVCVVWKEVSFNY